MKIQQKKYHIKTERFSSRNNLFLIFLPLESFTEKFEISLSVLKLHTWTNATIFQQFISVSFLVEKSQYIPVINPDWPNRTEMYTGFTAATFHDNLYGKIFHENIFDLNIDPRTFRYSSRRTWSDFNYSKKFQKRPLRQIRQ